MNSVQDLLSTIDRCVDGSRLYNKIIVYTRNIHKCSMWYGGSAIDLVPATTMAPVSVSKSTIIPHYLNYIYTTRRLPLTTTITTTKTVPTITISTATLGRDDKKLAHQRSRRKCVLTIFQNVQHSAYMQHMLCCIAACIVGSLVIVQYAYAHGINYYKINWFFVSQ